MWIANRIPRFLCAGILLVAAGLKAYELVADPALGTIYGSRWLQLLLIEYEVFLGSWLLVGAAQHAVRYLALTTFAAFGCYAFYLGITGAASCGCFGRVEMNPLWMFTIDSVAVALLWHWRPSAESAHYRWRAISAVAAAAVLGIVPMLFISESAGAEASEGFVIGDSFVALEPEKWLHGRFPLSRELDIGDSIMHGSWTILLYHHECPKCQQVLCELRSYSSDPHAGILRRQLAVLEVPSSNGEEFGPPCACRYERLRSSVRWLVPTPTVLELDNGTVTDVRVGGGS